MEIRREAGCESIHSGTNSVNLHTSKSMNKFTLILFFTFCFTSSLFSQTGSAEAFQLFSKGQYESALNAYKSLIDQYGASADLYFNAGLCNLYLHHIGEAKLDFERALLLKPNSRQIKVQLSLINQGIEPKIESLPPFFLYKWITAVRDLFNKASWGWFTLFFSLCFGALGVARYVFKRHYSVMMQWFVILGLGICGIFFLARNKYERMPNAILMVPNALKIAPEAKAQDLLPLGIGTKMQLIDSLQDWYKIQLENNDQGWIPKSSIHKV